jgi:hypothetical protein
MRRHARGVRPLLPALVLALAVALPSIAFAQDGEPDPLPEAGTVLEPGRYVSALVGPTIDFHVDEGWVAGPSGNGPIFTLEFVDAPGSVLSVTRFDGDTFLDSCDPSSLTLVEPTASRLAEIIAGNPFLNPGSTAVLDVDGYRGLWFDVGVPAWDPTECALGYLLLWAIPVGEGGEFVQVADQQSRFIILDVDGDAIVIAIESFPGVPFGAFLEAAMELVRSMHIVPGEYVPPATASPVPSAVPSPAPESTPAASQTPDAPAAGSASA